MEAVDNKTCEIVGTSFFAFHGFKLDEVPKVDLGEEPMIEKPPVVESERIRPEDMTEADKAIAWLEDIEEKGIQRWQKVSIPPGSKCIIVVGHGVIVYIHITQRLLIRKRFQMVSTLKNNLSSLRLQSSFLVVA